MLFLVAIAFLLERYGTQAAPLPVFTTTSSPFDTPIFARDNLSEGCHSRTVLDILWSCLATTFACTWVSVHPNVPFKGEGKWSLLGRRIFLMFFSILAPEFMIVWAFRQWRGAVMIREGVNKALENASPSTVKPLWTTVHGHFLQMGGFRLLTTAREMLYYNDSGTLRKRDDALIPTPFVIAPHKRATITGLISEELYEHAEGEWPNEISADASRVGFGNGFREGVLTYGAFQKLLAEDLIRFPAINEGEISDRSKGDELSKSIALLQLTWFIVQIISRAAQGLSITELELTTAALAGLNSVMYVFWWSKPRDVRFPVVIRTKGVEELLAKRTEDTTWSFSDQKEFDFREHLWTSMTAPMKDGTSALRKLLVSSFERIKSVPSYLANAIRVLPHHLHYYLSQIHRGYTRTIRDLKGGLTVEPKRSSEKESNGAPAVVYSEPHSAKENMSRMQQIYGALISGAEAVKHCFVFIFSLPVYGIFYGLFVPIAQILYNDGSSASGEQFRMFSMMFYSEDVEVKPLLSTASIAGALFGGVHCLAWHFSFPSHAEQIMWRTAPLGIVGACAFSLVGNYLWKDDVYNIDYDKLDGVLRKIGYCFLAVLQLMLLLLTTIVYPVFRLMLLVIAITSLRSLPPSAFDTVQWIEFVPHI